MLQLIAEARQLGAREVFLEVRADNQDAQSLYRSLGFAALSVRKGYYKGGIDAIIMRLAIPEPEVRPGMTGPAGARDRDELRRDRRRHRPRHRAAVQRHRILDGRARALWRRRARRSPRAPIWMRCSRPCARPSTRPASGCDDLDAIAVTSGPGLAGALMVGVGAAKALAIALDKPLYAVNHLVGHVGVDVLDSEPLEYPTIALLVSGGHTSLVLVRDLLTDVELLGETIDDAAGEAFDKVARLLGLPYPGGPEIDRAAAGGDPGAIPFPRGLTRPKDLEAHRYDFSFSGLKTAVARYVEATPELSTADVAASFREAVVDVLVGKAIAACQDLGVPRLLLGGGVIANARLREVATERAADAGIALRIPPLSLCTDNGAMIASLGAQLMAAGPPSIRSRVRRRLHPAGHDHPRTLRA